MHNEEILVSVIIVSFNTRTMTLDCLKSLYADLASLERPSEVFVVDNASVDGTIQAIRTEFPEVQLIESPVNCGFGAANNLAMKQARGAYFLLLNSDAFLEPGAISQMLECIGRHPEAAVVGPRLLNADHTMQLSCFRFPSPSRAWLENLWIATILSWHPVIGDYRKWAHDSERVVDSVTGACMLVRRESCEQVGGFDEQFFMYAEETDWQRRMASAGWKTVFTPDAQVVHLAGGSESADKPAINKHFFRSLDLYELKHHGTAGFVSLRLAMCIGCFLRLIGWLFVSLLPQRRVRALEKVRKMCSLLVRQAANWPRAGQ